MAVPELRLHLYRKSAPLKCRCAHIRRATLKLKKINY